MVVLKFEAVRSVFCTVVLVLSVPNAFVFVPVTNHHLESSTYLDTLGMLTDLATTEPLALALTPPTPGSFEYPPSWKWTIVYSAGRWEPSVCEAQEDVNTSISASPLHLQVTDRVHSPDTLSNLADCGALTNASVSLPKPPTLSNSLTDESDISPLLFNQFHYYPQPSPPIFNPVLKAPIFFNHLNLTSNSIPALPFSLQERLSREYLPMPGSDSGILQYLEQLKSLLRNIVFSTLSGPWADWVISNHPMFGVVCVTIMYSSLLCPVFLVACGYRKAERALSTNLLMCKGHCKMLESQIGTIRKEKSSLLAKLSSAKEELAKMKEQNESNSHELETLRESNWRCGQQLNNMILGRTHFESRLHAMRKALSCANNQTLSNKNEIRMLLGKVNDQQERLAVFSSNMNAVFKKFETLKEEKELLEVAIDVEKRAKDTTMNNLITLQASFEKVKMELKITLKECVAKDEKLESVTKNISSLENELFAKEEIVCQQEAELEQLHVALSLVTKKHSEQDAPCEVDEEYELDLQRSAEQICNLYKELERKSSSLEQVKNDTQKLEEFVYFLEAGYKKKSEQLKEAERKLEEMADDCQAKENFLQEKLAQARLKEYKIQKKLMEAEREFEEEREEWRDLKKQLLSHISSVQYDKEDREEMEQECDLREYDREEAKGADQPLLRQSLNRALCKNQKTLLPVKTLVQLYQPSSTRSAPLNSSPLLLSTKASRPQQMFPLTRSRSSGVPSSVAKPVPRLRASCSDSDIRSGSSDKCISSTTALVPGTLSCGPVSVAQNVTPTNNANDISCVTLTTTPNNRKRTTCPTLHESNSS